MFTEDSSFNYKLTPNEISENDIPFIRAFIVYLNTCISIAEERVQKRGTQKMIRSSKTRKTPKVEVKEDDDDEDKLQEIESHKNETQDSLDTLKDESIKPKRQYIRKVKFIDQL